jgi:DNA repair protein RecO (recombination protein O)
VIARTQAIVLRVQPFSNTSHIVTWLTPRLGRVSTLVKGSCRPRSLFLGQYDLFYTCDLLFYARARADLHIARESVPVDTRASLRSDWRGAAGASYACDLLARCSVAGQTESGLYDLTVHVLDALGMGAASPQLLYWFELRLLRCLGLAPQLWRCAACGAPITGPHAALFSGRRGGLLCRPCEGEARADGAHVRPDTLAVLRCWDEAEAPRAALRTDLSGNQLIALGRTLGVCLGFHLDVPSESRRIALELVSAAREP